MATKIITKFSETSGSEPTTSDVDKGELAVNVVDKLVYTQDGTDVITLGTEEYITSARAAQWDTAYSTAPGSIDAADITSGTLASGRLSGSYTINVTGNVTGNVTSSGTSTFNTVQIGTNWTATELGDQLEFRYDGTAVMSIDNNGDLIISGTVTESGTP